MIKKIFWKLQDLSCVCYVNVGGVIIDSREDMSEA